jgi:acetyl-CoA synthetase
MITPDSINRDVVQGNAEQVQAWLSESGGATVPLAHLLCDRYAADPTRVALRYEDATGNEQTYTFAELRDTSARFAGVLAGLGVARGDRVATLLPRSPELIIACLGLWRLGAAQVPLFTAFGPQAVTYRLAHSGAKVVVTDHTNRLKVEPKDSALRVVTVEGTPGALPAGDVPFWSALGSAAPVERPVTVSGDDLLIQIYTSGTTGQPKGVEVPVRALASFAAYLRFGLDVRDDDVYWNILDPGWAGGLYYALVAPLLLGHPTILVNARFDVQATWRAMGKYGVTNFMASPTLFRAMRAAGIERATGANPVRLRAASSGGEPLNPEVVAWAETHFGIPIHDTFGQTELGMAICNHHAPGLRRPLRPGSMGHPMPGFRVVVVDSDYQEVGPGQEGQIAIDTTQSPLYWFRGYYKDAERTAERFGAGRYYLTGDMASRDADGYFYFSGRGDDIINSSGYRIGPFEVESALVGHPAVAEAAVVGKPDPLRGEVVKAFVVLRPGYAATADLGTELGQFVKTRLAAHLYPREIVFVDQLPKTPSGKVQHYLLRGS